MARRLWGCYSVADHLAPRAFVADLLLYDRLLIPTPAPDDRGRWEERWDPERQARLLEILGPFAKGIEWNAPLREQWEEAWSTADLARDADSAYEYTRMVISRQLEAEVQHGDVRALAVYASPDKFDRDWQLVRSPLFLRRGTTVRPGALTQAMGAAPTKDQELAKLVVTELVVPDDGLDDEEVLKRTVDLVSRPGVTERRAELHERIAALSVKEGIRDQTVVTEIGELVDAFNQAVRRNTQRNVARACLTGLTWAAGGFALWFPPLGVAAGPAATLGDALVRRLYGDQPAPGGGGIELLSAAQRALTE